MTNIVDVSGLAGHTLKDSDGAAATLPKDGSYALKIKSPKITVASSGNTVLNLTLAVQDDDAKGAILYYNRPVTGQSEFKDDRTNETVVRKHVENLGNILDSAGLVEYKLQIAKEGKFDLDKIAAKLDGQLLYGFVMQKQDDRGEVRSDVRSLMTGKKYEENKKAGGHNWRRDPQTRTGVSAAGGNGSPAATAAKAAAADAMRGEV